MIEYINGDLLETNVKVIMHQTNCLGAMGAGIALQIKKKYPEVYEKYVEFCKSVKVSKELLGECLIVKTNNNKYIANLFGEDKFYPVGVRHTDYDALKKSLTTLKTWMIENNIKTCGCPDMIGCGLAGGSRDIVLNFLKSLFEEDTDITLKIVKYNK